MVARRGVDSGGGGSGDFDTSAWVRDCTGGRGGSGDRKFDRDRDRVDVEEEAEEVEV